jgi:hypothetical protein
MPVPPAPDFSRPGSSVGHPQLPLQLEEAVGEPASLIATVLSRRSEATAVASTSLYTQNSVLNADSSWDLQKENWLLLLKWVIIVVLAHSGSQ